MALFNKKTKEEPTAKPAKKEAKAPAKKQPVEVKKTEVPAMKDLYAGEAKKEKAAAQTKKGTSRAYRVLIKPLVTEKATNLGGQNQYVFMVEMSANKIEVAKAINDVYGLKPLGVNIIKMKGKRVSRGRITGRRKDFKKAIVTLPKGETIKVYEGV